MKAKLKIFIFPLAIFFLIASTLCCCLPLSSHAEASDTSNYSSHQSEKRCHTSDSKETQQSNHADCSCGHEQLLAVNSSLNLDLGAGVLSQWSKFQDVQIFLSTAYNPQTNLSQRQIHSPPFLISRTTPLFIKNSILRI